MMYFILRDNVAKQLTPVFEQNTVEAAKRVLKKDTAIMASAGDFDICCIGQSAFDSDGDPYFDRNDDREFSSLVDFLDIPF